LSRPTLQAPRLGPDELLPQLDVADLEGVSVVVLARESTGDRPLDSGAARPS
jgi:hypothetical protein